LPNSISLTSGTFKPTNFGASDTFSPPAPTGPYASTLATFNGSNPNGAWSLYVVDDEALDSGSIAGWSLAITTTGNVEQVLATNTGLTLDQGTTAVITTAMLETTDVDNGAVDLVYTITAGPMFGSVLRGGSPASQFTQQDINDGLVGYQHDGSENFVDGFDFSVDDGAGSASAGVFSISILPPLGDYNRDGGVGTADYVLWRAMLGSNVPVYTSADGSGDGVVGPEDHDVYIAHFGQTYPGAGSGGGEQSAARRQRGASRSRPSDEGLRLEGWRGDPMSHVEGRTSKAALDLILEGLAELVGRFGPGTSTVLDRVVAPGSAAAMSTVGGHDSALVEWLASRSRPKERGAENDWEPRALQSAGESPRDWLRAVFEAAFEGLAADAA
jgi:hypothetical protein